MRVLGVSCENKTLSFWLQVTPDQKRWTQSTLLAYIRPNGCGLRRFALDLKHTGSFLELESFSKWWISLGNFGGKTNQSESWSGWSFWLVLATPRTKRTIKLVVFVLEPRAKLCLHVLFEWKKFMHYDHCFRTDQQLWSFPMLLPRLQRSVGNSLHCPPWPQEFVSQC